MARLESVRTLIATSFQQGLQLHQVDVTTAFLNGKLKEEVFMKQPEGFVVPGKEHLVRKLKKNIYGLKQSPRCWNSTLHNHLKRMGFIQMTTDPCVYRSSGGELAYLGVYVDDIIAAARNDKCLAQVKKDLTSQFEIKDLGRLYLFLGMKICRMRQVEVFGLVNLRTLRLFYSDLEWNMPKPALRPLIQETS